MTDTQITLNGKTVPCKQGDSLMTVCEQNATYVPHLCHRQGLTPHGSCRLCIVNVNQQVRAACITPVIPDAVVETETPALHQLRLHLTQLLFIEGNHFCPYCELSGNCQLQAMAYHLGMLEGHYPHAYPRRPVDATHAEVIIDRDRCINCALCVRASDQLDHKHVFELVGRGAHTTLAPHSASGALVDTALSGSDRACHVCPTGALLLRAKPYAQPIGTRLYDTVDIAVRGHVRPEDPEAPVPHPQEDAS